jgi:hypothetical protein
VVIDMAFVRMMEVTIVEIVDVAAVADGAVAATRPMLVSMVRMGLGRAGRHELISFPCPRSADTAGAPLGRMFDGVMEHRRQVLVGESVKNVLRFAPPLDQTHHEQRLQPSGYGRDLLALVFSQLRHASLARSEPHEKPEPFRIAGRSEHLGSGFDLYPRRKANDRARRMPTVPA